jgi:hypothetical protein
MSYNGWTNYETWAVKLWLDNEPGTYHDATRRADLAISAGEERYELADWLKEYVGAMMPDLPASLASDLLNGALSDVDWFEVADSYLDDAREAAQ